MARVDTGRDVFFAENGYTFTRLLHLRADGTFARYSREHMFVAIDDEGRWRQSAVEVSAATFRELLGTRQGFMFHTEMSQVIPRDAELEDRRRKRLEAPECGAFEDLARPLPATKRKTNSR